MPLDLKLLESLLHEAEGTSLDFKSAQYRFENAHDGEKAELLKDILALANSWRRTTAYILIGVEEVNGGRSNVAGVEKHLEDASLHQFVNGKTQRPVEFNYQAIQIDGTTIGAIEIPLQKRPVYLNRRFDGLAAHEVFIRDGSSTRAATPEEIAKMGAEEVVRECCHIHRHSRESGNPKAIGSKCVFASYRIPGSRFRGDDGNRRLETDILKLTTLPSTTVADSSW